MPIVAMVCSKAPGGHARCSRVEGSIGTIKSQRYGFNKPNAKSTTAMARCGQRAILGFNMRKMVREWTAMQAAGAPA